MSFNLEPFFEAPLAIQIHLLGGILAFIVGIVVFAMRKGTARHRSLGKVWVAIMAVVALSSFFIHELRTWGLFSPIHLLSVFTLGSLVSAIYLVRKRNIRAHELTMKGLFAGGVIVAGGLTFGRDLLMNKMFLSPATGAAAPSLNAVPGGPATIALGSAFAIFLAVLTWDWLYGRKQTARR